MDVCIEKHWILEIMDILPISSDKLSASRWKFYSLALYFVWGSPVELPLYKYDLGRPIQDTPRKLQLWYNFLEKAVQHEKIYRELTIISLFSRFSLLKRPSFPQLNAVTAGQNLSKECKTVLIIEAGELVSSSFFGSDLP